MKLKLPRYTVAKPRKNKVDFYFSIPARLRPQGWSSYIKLSSNMQDAFQQADALNKRLDAERDGTTQSIYIKGSLPMIVREYQHSPEYKGLAPDTQRLYDQCIKHILKGSEKAGHPHIRHLTRPIILAYLKKFNYAPTLKKKIGGMWRILCEKAIDLGEITENPALRLKLKEKRKPAHIYTDNEVERLTAAALAIEEPAIARAVATAYSIGQREGDILKIKVPENYRDGVFYIVQSKTGEILEIPAPQALRTVLDDVKAGHLIGKAFKADWFRHRYAQIRDKAGLPATAKFMHFRHSACVRLARAGNTVPEIASVSGHSLQTAAAILKLYLPRDPEVTRNAIKKLDKYQKKARTTSKQPVDSKGMDIPLKVVQTL